MSGWAGLIIPVWLSLSPVKIKFQTKVSRHLMCYLGMYDFIGKWLHLIN